MRTRDQLEPRAFGTDQPQRRQPEARRGRLVLALGRLVELRGRQVRMTEARVLDGRIDAGCTLLLPHQAEALEVHVEPAALAFAEAYQRDQRELASGDEHEESRVHTTTPP